MSARPDLRQRKKAETRARLADAALSLALEHGPAAITVEQIAEVADVSPRTFFNHFASKDDAVLAVDPAEKADLLRILTERDPDLSPLQALRSVVIEHLTSEAAGGARLVARARLISAHPSLEAAHLAHLRDIEDHLEAAVAGRLGTDRDSDPYPALLVACVSSALRTAMAHLADTGRDPVVVVDEIFDVLERGFEPPTR